MAAALPTIPVQSISYEAAREILKSLGGNEEAFQGWRGGLDITYKLGGETMDGNLKLNVETTNNLEMHEIRNVIGIIKGAVEQDRYVSCLFTF